VLFRAYAQVFEKETPEPVAPVALPELASH
jgi:hypothetical protein